MRPWNIFRTFFGLLKKLRTFEAFDIILKKCLHNLMRNIVFMYLTLKWKVLSNFMDSSFIMYEMVTHQN